MKLKSVLIGALLMATLVSCIAPAVPTPAPAAPQPSPLLGTIWRFDRVVVNGEVRPDLKKMEHYLEFTWRGQLLTDDGCNTTTVPIIFSSTDRSFEFEPEFSKTVVLCHIVYPEANESVLIEDRDYIHQVLSSAAYDLHDSELWLYYPDTKANALVYKLSRKVPPPTEEPAGVVTIEVEPAATLQPSPPAISGSSLAIINGTLIDGTGADPLKDAVLIIQGKRIAAVGPRSSISIPNGAQIIDVQGATILPGFFNAHVHGAYNEEKLAAWAQEGVTTVRDLGAYQWPPSKTLLDRIEQDNRYARLISGGIFITPPGGYPIAVFGGNGKTISTTQEAPQAVNELLAQGAEVIKISLESGQIFRQSIPMLTTEQVQAIVATAHQRGTRVSAHATVTKDLKRAIDEGVDDVAHMVVDPINDDLIKAMIARDMYWVPTIELWMNVGQGQDVNVIDNLRRYAAAGGKVALGTDFEGYYTPFQLGLPTKEIAWMSEAGMTPMQIIVAATQNAARVSNVEKDLGTLGVGQIADVLIVQGDPLQDLQALSKVQYVIHNGEVIREP